MTHRSYLHTFKKDRTFHNRKAREKFLQDFSGHFLEEGPMGLFNPEKRREIFVMQPARSAAHLQENDNLG
jgi:hypothetical protein